MAVKLEIHKKDDLKTLIYLEINIFINKIDQRRKLDGTEKIFINQNAWDAANVILINK